MTNKKERQTIYGAYNYLTHEVRVKTYDTGNTWNTIDYIEHLRMLSHFEKIMIIWDGATYHRFSGMEEYLRKVNKGLNEKEWEVRCILLAPYTPKENPMEDIWLQGKNWLRKKFRKNKTFEDVVECFMNFINRRIFDFEKVSIFGTI